ncbi:MAG: YciI family protein [Alphaproteobacteria bacterium]|nr:YciI family protein [Alphaproteobacteria bacterium]
MSEPMAWDEYGARCRAAGNLAMEVFACLTTPIRPGPPPPDTLAAHKSYLADLEIKGELFLAGPLSSEDGASMSGAGLIIFAATSLAAARALAEGDPMHQQGFRRFTLQAWRLNEGSPLPGLRLSNRGFDIAHG